MAPTSPPLSLLLLLCAAASLLRVAAAPSPTHGLPSNDLSPYEVLESYGLPVGLLPKGALGYDLDRSSGRFTVRLNGTCSFSLEGSYDLRYQPTVTGVISSGRLRSLDGVSVKVLVFWISIIEVTRKGDELEFSVGIASAHFSVSNFLESPQCGCGFDCLGMPSSSGMDGRESLELEPSKAAS